MLTLLALLACKPQEAEREAWTLRLDGDTLTVEHTDHGAVIEGLRFSLGTGVDAAEMRFGSFLFEPDGAVYAPLSAGESLREREGAFELVDADGAVQATLAAEATAQGGLRLAVRAADPSVNRVRLEASCDAEDHFLGLGGHQQDVDHVGQAFPLWVSEPGVGKVDTEVPPADWFLRGTRHAASFPVPFLLRPHRATGLLVETYRRVEVDLCASQADRFTVSAWDGEVDWLLLAAERPVGVVQALTAHTGRAPLPQPWVFAPWLDAIRDTERVMHVANTLREAGAPSSVIWTEDWKGGHQTAVGYHLTGEWELDETIYPGADATAAELEAMGFKWFAYFNPFIRKGYRVWDEAVAADVLVKNAAGEPYEFSGAGFTDEGLLDLTSEAGRDFAKVRMEACLDHGFDGWMADYAEWLPLDAVLADGSDPWEAHNRWPELWQELNVEVMEGRDASFFARSGWTRTSGIAPVVWAGDQSTSFEPLDGYPTVVAMALGMGASGVPVFTHDVAGYQTYGVGPSSKELWFRWAGLGAFSPILRTHHGTEDLANWQFDSDEETTAYFARMAQENVRLFPYRYGLARRASEEGIPMILPPAMVVGGEDWGRSDAWMLGDALLVAPVLEEGATSREVRLPDTVRWFDWWTGDEAQSGVFAAPVDHTPVFVAAGTTVPTLVTLPDTLFPVEAPLRDLDDVDGERLLTLYGGGGPFTEADGTRYTPSGAATSAAEQTVTLASGAVEVGGVSLQIDGPRERTYTVRVIP